MKPRRVQRLLARTLFLTAAVLALASTTSPAPAAASGQVGESLLAKVVVIGVPGLTWNDVKA
ncbi:MAG TPA: hypothetical protein VFG33_09330, partial [Kribbella sp.]|uniref:hypothetical protein n=1 Tax=Kribbella sp. TaxID=1871183 RepID=UPI002D7971C3